MKQFFLAIFFFVLLIPSAKSQTLAFPSAEGFGKLSTGGRGGQVVEVTRLDDYLTTGTPIQGTFRWALTQYPGQPLTVVFRVSGIIQLIANVVNGTSTNDIRCNRAGLTIAGQTAPGDGICIRGAKLNLGGSTNLVIRHVRFRVGKANGNDGAFIPGGSIDFENGSYAIFDHCDFGWSAEENITMYDNHYTTVQWSVLHEGLFCAGHEKGERSYGAQWAGSPATMHHNLFMSNVSRSGRFNGSNNPLGDRNVLIDYVNNVNYNWGKKNSCYGGEREAQKFSTHEVNFVGNYYKPGPTTPTSGNYFFEQSAARSGYVLTGPSYWYVTGNVMEGDAAGTANNWLNVHNNTSYPMDSLKSLVVRTIPDAYKMAYTSAQDAYTAVLAKAGAFPRDAVDRRIMNEVSTKTASGRSTIARYPSAINTAVNPPDTTWTANRYYGLTVGIIDEPAGAGGYPTYNTYNQIVDNDHDGMDDAWELANGLDPTNPNDRNLLTNTGYTALEVYLNSLVGETIDHNFTSTDVEKLSDHKILISPTITSDKLNITSDENLKFATIYTIDGAKVFTVAVANSKLIDVTLLTQGCYLMQVITQNGRVERFKFIKR